MYLKRKALYIVLTNIFLVCLIFIGFDAYTFYNCSKREIHYTDFKSFYKRYVNFYKVQFSSKDKTYFYNQYILGKFPNGDAFYKSVVNSDSPLEPILLFGCSYTEGYKIPERSAAHEVFGRYTQRPVYSRAKGGFGTDLMLYQLQNEDFYKIIPKPKYVIYTFICDHYRRMKMPCMPYLHCLYDIFYKIKNDKLELMKNQNKICFFSLTKELIFYLFFQEKNNSYKNSVKNLMLSELLECNRLIKAHWRDSEFIIFVYTQKYNPLEELTDKLKENGIKVIHRRNVAPFDDSDERYTLSKTDEHPNEKAWEYIVPLLMKYIEKDNN